MSEEHPTAEVEVTVTLRVKAKLSTVDCEGTTRTDLTSEFLAAIKTAVEEDMPYEIDDREPGDLVQSTPEVEIVNFHSFERDHPDHGIHL